MTSIPRADLLFNIFQMVLSLFVKTNLLHLAIDQQWFNDKYMVAKLYWEEAWAAYLDASKRTKAVTNHKNAMRKIFEKLVGELIAMLKADPNVTEEDLKNLNIADGKGGGKHNDPPTDVPHFNFFIGLLRHIIIYFGLYGKNMILRGRPKGVHGAEVRWGILDSAPQGIEDLHESSFMTESPFNFEFKEEERGRFFYFCIRWENTTGQKGPWSEIVGVRIP